MFSVVRPFVLLSVFNVVLGLALTRNLNGGFYVDLSTAAKEFFDAEVDLEGGFGEQAGSELDEYQTARTRTTRGPWNGPNLVALDKNSRNLCSNNKQLPDLYVIGQQKCGTSSLAADLMDAGVANVHGPHNPKEFHWFNSVMRMNYQLDGLHGVYRNRKSWEAWMPVCPGTEDETATQQNARRQPLADFTPAYMSVVPRPENMVPTGPWLRVFDSNISIPKEMVKLHGVEAAKKLTLVMMLREPMSQMQSAWYHAESFNFTNVCASCRAPSFKAALTDLHTGLQQTPPTYNQWLWNVMYGAHLAAWVEQFDASQFYIVPTHIYSKGDSASICQDLSKRMDWAMECKTERVVSHQWTHAHPPLEEDVPKTLIEGIRDMLKDDSELLIKTLAKGSKKGMGLANYKGAPGDEHAIAEWLNAGW
eukprot:TRINITY_DN72705_c0_g1_i1.p1 TRINITY_DN72705_c0_g1~~TRINITY_DN72705_c0_g1_i1.p1  ORF type:complete len:420 (+),score=86.01 TRINITY_DN72705_c0_g1_i1:117-1376(+)